MNKRMFHVMELISSKWSFTNVQQIARTERCAFVLLLSSVYLSTLYMFHTLQQWDNPYNLRCMDLLIMPWHMLCEILVLFYKSRTCIRPLGQLGYLMSDLWDLAHRGFVTIGFLLQFAGKMPTWVEIDKFLSPFAICYSIVYVPY